MITPKLITFNVMKAQVIVNSYGTDLICLHVDAPTAYPETKYPTTLTISARHGYGETWCKETLGIVAEIIKSI